MLVQLTFDDLYRWHNWFWENRRRPPLNLIAVGSNPNPKQPGDRPNTMQGARWESGMDNSPMYNFH